MSADKPTEQSTRPDGNTPLRPSQLERGIGENVAAKLRDFPDANRRVKEHLAKKKSQSGHARG
ncbi:MAG: hypothetical protein WAV38_39635 [Xanthobacteraceae bacterium]